MIARTFAAAALVLFGLTAAACDPSGTAATADPRASAGADDRSGRAAGAKASASAAAPGHPQAGRWVAEFEAVRGSISVPKGVPYKWWEGDDGVAATGKGTVRLVVTAEGAVTGSGAGALGPLLLRGAIEDGTLRAGVFPVPEGDGAADEDAGSSAGQAMSGVLVGTVSGDAIEGELRVSSHDAILARHAPIRLSKER